jgi:hypothetical protein
LHRRIGLAAVALSALVVAAGCGEKEEPEGGDPGAPPVIPVDGDAIVLQAFTGGGYVPPIDARRAYPEIVLYADGRLLTATTETREMALPMVAERHLSETQVEEVARTARETGLNEEHDYGTPEVTDLPTTTVVFETADARTENSAYALGFDDADAGLSSEQVEAREELSGFLEDLTDVDSELGTELPSAVPFEPEAYVVSSIELEGATAPGGPAVKWPLAANRFASEKEPDVCTVVEGDDTEVLEKAAEEVGVDQVWESNGTRAEVAIRPAIGLEDDCPKTGASYLVGKG